MGSLGGAVHVLLESQAVAAEDVLLLNDVPNCDIPSANKTCSTGSLPGDDASWFATLAKLGLNGTWGVWDFV